jgi:predicted glycosyltransferase
MSDKSTKSFGPLPPGARSVSTGRRPRIVLYSHDTLGYGHLRRNMLLAAAMKRCAGAPDILMIAGMREAGAFALPAGVDCISLPAYAKNAQGQYAARDLSTGLEGLRSLRAATIRATVAAFDPDLMIVDNVPRGAQFELDPALKALRKAGRARIILGLRDVIDDPATTRRQWLRQRNFEALREFYSDVWIYGDPVLYDTAAEYGIDTASQAAITYTGYLDQRARLDTPAGQEAFDALVGDDPRPYVLCTVGGGRDGDALTEAFARAVLPKGHRGVLITGSQMSAENRQRIAAIAAGRADLTVVEFVREPVVLAARAAAIVGMGGYNTTSEMLSLGRPALIVPRVRPRQEQLLRAARLAALGLLDMIHPDALTPAGLAAWIADAVTRAPAPRDALDMGGLERVQMLADAALADCAAALRKSA